MFSSNYILILNAVVEILNKGFLNFQEKDEFVIYDYISNSLFFDKNNSQNFHLFLIHLAKYFGFVCIIFWKLGNMYDQLNLDIFRRHKIYLNDINMTNNMRRGR